MDSEREGKVSWLRKEAIDPAPEGQQGPPTAQDAGEAFQEEGQEEISDPVLFGENAGELALINKILNHPEFLAMANSQPGTKEEFERLATDLRQAEVAGESPDLIEAMNSIANIVPSMFRETQFNEFFSELSQTKDDADTMVAQERAIQEV